MAMAMINLVSKDRREGVIYGLVVRKQCFSKVQHEAICKLTFKGDELKNIVYCKSKQRESLEFFVC